MTASSTCSVHEEVRLGYKVGACLLPVKNDGTKRPDVAAWKQNKHTRPNLGEMKSFDFARREGYGLVAGAVSGYRGPWDFDEEETHRDFVARAAECGLGEVVRRIEVGYCDKTPNGGRRWLVEYPATVDWQDVTLARRPGRPGEPKVKTLIELTTFAILAPSCGAVHPSGRPYVRLSGGFSTIARVTLEEHRDLVALARSFDAMPHPEPARPSAKVDGGDRPGDDFNRRATWPEVLEPAGWTAVYHRGDVTAWRRPGKAHGISATTNLGGSDLLYVFSSSTLFDAEKSYSKFGAVAVLDHGGDFAAAAAALRARGFGASRDATPPPENAAPPSVVVPAESKFRFRTAAELAREQPTAPVWFVHGFLALGVITELAGKLKASGKTTFAAWLVRAVLDGLPFLGSPTRKTAVVWLTEERPPTFLETLKRAHLESREDLHILHWHDVKGVPYPLVIKAAVGKCTAVGAEVLIIDTISQFAGLRGESENNAGDALDAVEPLQMAAAHGLAVLVPRHERKGGGEVGESGRGSSAFSGAVDIVVSIRRGEGQAKPTVRVLHTLSRFTETPATLVMELTETGYVALGTEGTVAVLEAERALLDHLPSGETAAVALDAALETITPRIARTNAQTAVKNLMSIGQVKRIGKGRKGDGYRYFRPVEDSAGTQITRPGRNKTELEDGAYERL